MSRQEDETMQRVTVEFTVANNRDVQLVAASMLAPDKVRHARVQGVVDTGSSHMVLPASVVTQLGVPDAGEATIRYTDRRSATRQVVEEVRLELLGRHGTYKAIVEPDRTDALIGAIILEDLDLLVDCRTQTLQPRHPDRIIAEIE